MSKPKNLILSRLRLLLTNTLKQNTGGTLNYCYFCKYTCANIRINTTVTGSIKDDCYEKEPEHFLISGSLLDWDLNQDSNPGQA